MPGDNRLLLTEKPRSAWLWPGVILGVGALLALGVLYRFAPTEYAFYPRCMLHQLTGLHCPACGSLRALHALLHGELKHAFLANPLLILSLPLFTFAWLWHRRRRRMGLPGIATGWWWMALSVYVIFGLLRNLPWEPFIRLAP